MGFPRVAGPPLGPCMVRVHGPWPMHGPWPIEFQALPEDKDCLFRHGHGTSSPKCRRSTFQIHGFVEFMHSHATLNNLRVGEGDLHKQVLLLIRAGTAACACSMLPILRVPTLSHSLRMGAAWWDAN